VTIRIRVLDPYSALLRRVLAEVYAMHYPSASNLRIVNIAFLYILNQHSS